ncbi:MAG TPA: SDR family oxidoreductase [Cytophagaceae bacterium]|jgi:nucleoside-diphosphate-sugar epimerase
MILITGASGFIGKAVLVALQESYGYENVVALTSAPIINCQTLLHSSYNFSPDYFNDRGWGSICTIIHLGAFTPKHSSDANDLSNCAGNIFSTQKLLEAKLPNLKKIIFASTLDVYKCDTVITEETIIEPVSLYGNSKLYCERMIDIWANKKNIVHQILRIGHVYGPGEEEYQKIIPLSMYKLLKDQELEIWGTGEEVRSFIYLNDVVKALLKSIQLEKFIGPINLVGENQISVKDLINLLINMHGSSVQPVTRQLQAPGRNYIFNNDKMKRHLLASETPLSEGLAAEFDYMRNLVK